MRAKRAGRVVLLARESERATVGRPSSSDGNRQGAASGPIAGERAASRRGLDQIIKGMSPAGLPVAAEVDMSAGDSTPQSGGASSSDRVHSQDPRDGHDGDRLDRKLCQVGGLNENYSSRSGVLYHIQIEDRGPVLDRILEVEVRRVNVIVYCNYGQANARIIHSRDHDSRDVRTRDYGRFIQQKLQKLAAEARTIIEEKEARQVGGVKLLIRRYHRSRKKRDKKELDAAKTLYPHVFSRAWSELKGERPRPASAPSKVLEAEPEPDLLPVDLLYPLDPDAREVVMEIECIVASLRQSLRKLKALGSGDDILLQTCRRLVARANDSLTGRLPSDFNMRRLEMTRKHLLTTWRQVKSRLRALPAS